MTFRLVHANYDKETRRAYVELRDEDPDGDEMIVATIFSYRQSSIITKHALEQELATKARHLMRKDVNEDTRPDQLHHASIRLR